jgi:hypothetical protein
VSFQITILKVLAGHPDGRASVAELTSYVSRSRSSSIELSAAAKPPLEELHPMLPIEFGSLNL